MCRGAGEAGGAQGRIPLLPVEEQTAEQQVRGSVVGPAWAVVPSITLSWQQQYWCKALQMHVASIAQCLHLLLKRSAGVVDHLAFLLPFHSCLAPPHPTTTTNTHRCRPRPWRRRRSSSLSLSRGWRPSSWVARRRRKRRTAARGVTTNLCLYRRQVITDAEPTCPTFPLILLLPTCYNQTRRSCNEPNSQPQLQS